MKLVVANWKMNGSKDLISSYNKSFKNSKNLIACPPFVYLNEKIEFNLGAQNVHHQSSGAYTGEISAQMLSEIGAKYCLVGHSERRHIETNELIKLKANNCIEADITPIICIGESLAEYLNGKTNQVLEEQLHSCLPNRSGFWLAYEPLWAIGTGKTPTISEIANVHNMLKQNLPDTILLYGGSVNPNNVAEIFTIPNVDGVLVGGASLDIDAINKIYLAEKNTR